MCVRPGQGFRGDPGGRQEAGWLRVSMYRDRGWGCLCSSGVCSCDSQSCPCPLVLLLPPSGAVTLGSHPKHLLLPGLPSPVLPSPTAPSQPGPLLCQLLLLCSPVFHPSGDHKASHPQSAGLEPLPPPPGGEQGSALAHMIGPQAPRHPACWPGELSRCWPLASGVPTCRTCQSLFSCHHTGGAGSTGMPVGRPGRWTAMTRAWGMAG